MPSFAGSNAWECKNFACVLEFSLFRFLLMHRLSKKSNSSQKRLTMAQGSELIVLFLSSIVSQSLYEN